MTTYDGEEGKSVGPRFFFKDVSSLERILAVKGAGRTYLIARIGKTIHEVQLQKGSIRSITEKAYRKLCKNKLRAKLVPNSELIEKLGIGNSILVSWEIVLGNKVMNSIAMYTMEKTGSRTLASNEYMIAGPDKSDVTITRLRGR